MQGRNGISLVEWVAREVLPHEGSLRRWLVRALPPQDVEDAVQEVYCRISGLSDISHIRSARGYLFTTARMLVLEKLRRARIVSIESVAEVDSFGIAADEPSPERVAAGRIELDRVRKLVADLPERTRAVFELRKIEGLSQREVAVRLGIAEHTVENEVVKGLRLILKATAVGDDETKNEETARDERARNRRND